VNVIARATQRVLRIPSRLAEQLDLLGEMEGCSLGDGACLHPSSRVENNQSRQGAIVIAAHTHVLGQLVVLGHGGDIRIGEYCFIGEQSRIWSADSIIIGDRVLISHNVNIHDHNSHSASARNRHLHFNEIFTRGHPKVLEDVPSAPIVIEDDVWVGFNSTILKGVVIGRGAVVGAASVVTKNVAAYTIVAGNPARIIGEARP
jgi:acetyltransferase-like isoleucine patch superfamily enzyme